jgi:hypothetical protein
MNMVRDTKAGTGQSKKRGGFHTWTVEEVRQSRLPPRRGAEAKGAHPLA